MKALKNKKKDSGNYSNVLQNYLNTNENIWGTKFTV